MSSSSNANTSSYDLVVIGAGPSGLAAARSFHKTAPDSKVIVLEAREFIGGRTAPAERGAGYVDTAQRRVRRVCDNLGLDFYNVYDEGLNFAEALPGSIYSFQGIDAPNGMSLKTMLGILKFVCQLDKTGCALDSYDVSTASWAADPENQKKSLAELDKYSVADFVSSLTDDEEAIIGTNMMVSPIFGANTSEISLLWLLFYIKSNVSFARLSAVTDGAQGTKINHKGGFEEMCLGMAKDLPSDAIKCNSPVSSISSSSDEDEDGVVVVTVKTKDGNDIIKAKRCILALSPSLYKTIEFDPPLPEPKMALSEAFSGTSIYAKARVVYSSPWWREKGFSGQVASGARGPAGYVIDDVKPESFFEGDEEAAKTKRYGLMTLIVCREAAAEWRATSDNEKRKEIVCAQLHHLFGDERAVTECISYWDFDWSSDDNELAKYAGGCVPVLGPGNLEHWRHIRTPCWDGNLIFAGTETATIHCGYVDGAIQSGERAAEDALMSLDLGSSGYTEEEPQKHEEVPNNRSFIEMLLFGRAITPEALAKHCSKKKNVPKKDQRSCFCLGGESGTASANNVLEWSKDE